MINFIKRNAKFVVLTTVAFVIIAGLSTALILTNTGHGGRGRDRDRSPERVALIDEHRSERREIRGAYDATELADRGERGDRIDRTERRNRTEREPLTDEQIAERIEMKKEKLEQKLEDGIITQEEYDEKIEKLENGEYPLFDRAGRGKKNKDKDNEDAA